MGGLHPRTGFFILVCLVAAQTFSILGTVFFSAWCSCNNTLLDLRWGLQWIQIKGTSYSMGDGVLASSNSIGELHSTGQFITMLAIIGMLAGMISLLPAGMSAAKGGNGSFTAAFGLIALDIAARATGVFIYILWVKPSIAELNVTDTLDSFIPAFLKTMAGAALGCNGTIVGPGIVLSIFEIVLIGASLIVLSTTLDYSAGGRHPDDDAREINIQMHRASLDGPPHQMNDDFRASQAAPPYNPQDRAPHPMNDNYHTSQADHYGSPGGQWPPQSGPSGNPQGQMFASQVGPYGSPRGQMNDFQSRPQQAAPYGSPRGQMHGFQQPAGTIAGLQPSG